MALRKCSPSTFAVVERDGRVRHGYRCARCGIATRSTYSQEKRDAAVKAHVNAKHWRREDA